MSSSSLQHVHEAPAAQRIFARQVAMLYDGATVSQCVAMVVASVVAWSEWNAAPAMRAFAWLLAMICASAARLLLIVAYRRFNHSLPVAAWRTCFIGGSAVSGIIWGCAGLFLLDLPDVASHVMVVVALAGMAAAGVPYLAPRIGAYCAFSVPMLAPVALRLLSQSDVTLISMGVATIVFLIAMISVAWRDHRTLTTILRLEHHNDDLVDYLKSVNSTLSIEMQQRERAQQDLHATVSVLRATLNAAADGILVLDFTGRIVSYNRRLLEMWNVPDELIIAKGPEALLHHLADQLREPEVFHARMRELFRSRTEEPRLTLQCKDGRILERRSVPYSVSGGDALGRVWMFHDAAQAHLSAAV